MLQEAGQNWWRCSDDWRSEVSWKELIRETKTTKNVLLSGTSIPWSIIRYMWVERKRRRLFWRDSCPHSKKEVTSMLRFDLPQPKNCAFQLVIFCAYVSGDTWRIHELLFGYKCLNRPWRLLRSSPPAVVQTLIPERRRRKKDQHADLLTHSTF